MFELIGLIATGGATVLGYIQSRRFVKRKLTFVDAARGSAAPWLAGAAAAAVATPIAWILPLVGTGTALLFGVGVGAGVAAGARDLRKRLGSGY